MVAGGYNSEKGYLDSVEINIVGGREWSFVQPLPVRMSAHKGLTFDNNIYMLGKLVQLTITKEG